MANRYWIGGSGTWDGSSTTHWSSSSGGLGGASVPTTSDDVYFDTLSSVVSYTVTISGTTGKSNSISIGLPLTGVVSMTGNTLVVSGSFTNSSGNIFTGLAGIELGGSGTFTSGGSSFDDTTVVFIGTGTYTLQDALTAEAVWVDGSDSGTVDFNGKNITTNDLEFYTNPNALLRGGTFNVTLGSFGFLFIDPNSTGVDFGTSTFVCSSTLGGGGPFTVEFGDNTIYNLSFIGDGSDEFQFYSTGVTVNNLSIAAGQTLRTIAGKTIATQSISATGTAGNLITIYSTGGASYFSQASGTVSCDYLDLTDSHATGGAAFYAGTHSVDNGGNAGWIFTAPGSPSSSLSPSASISPSSSNSPSLSPSASRSPSSSVSPSRSPSESQSPSSSTSASTSPSPSPPPPSSKKKQRVWKEYLFDQGGNDRAKTRSSDRPRWKAVSLQKVAQRASIPLPRLPEPQKTTMKKHVFRKPKASKPAKSVYRPAGKIGTGVAPKRGGISFNAPTLPKLWRNPNEYRPVIKIGAGRKKKLRRKR